MSAVSMPERVDGWVWVVEEAWSAPSPPSFLVSSSMMDYCEGGPDEDEACLDIACC